MTGLGIVHAPMLREKNGARRARKGESLALRERGGPLHPAHFVSEYLFLDTLLRDTFAKFIRMIL